MTTNYVKATGVYVHMICLLWLVHCYINTLRSGNGGEDTVKQLGKPYWITYLIN